MVDRFVHISVCQKKKHTQQSDIRKCILYNGRAEGDGRGDSLSTK